MTTSEYFAMADTLSDVLEIPAKRLYFPATLTTGCSKCGEAVTRDFRDEYLSYPSTNEKMTVYVHCAACEVEMPVQVILRITLELF